MADAVIAKITELDANLEQLRINVIIHKDKIAQCRREIHRIVTEERAELSAWDKEERQCDQIMQMKRSLELELKKF